MADNKTTIEEQIKQQGDLVRSLKSQKADKEKVIFLLRNLIHFSLIDCFIIWIKIFRLIWKFRNFWH